eukprot:505985_1
MRISTLIYIPLISLFCLLAVAINITWTTLPITIPFNCSHVITALDVNTDLVWIIGGFRAHPIRETDAIYQWNMTSGDSFTHIGALSCGTYAKSQDWVIRDNIIYWIRVRSIKSFNMTSAMEIGNDLDASFPSRSNDVCVTTDNDKYLLVIGGSGLDEEFSVVDQIKVVNYTRIYNFETKTWLSNMPHLNEGRKAHSCHVYKQYVYVIAGEKPYPDGRARNIRTIEKLDLNTLSNWIWLGYILNTPRSTHRSALIDDFIIVTGGYSKNYNQYGGCWNCQLKSVEIISMVDDSITSGTDLNIAVYRHGIIRGPMNNVIVLGGYTSSGATNRIQSTRAPTTPAPNTPAPITTTKESDDNSDTETTDHRHSNNWMMSTTVNDDHYESRKTKPGKTVALVIAILLLVILMVTACVGYISQRKNMKSNVETANENYQAM